LLNIEACTECGIRHCDYDVAGELYLDPPHDYASTSHKWCLACHLLGDSEEVNQGERFPRTGDLHQIPARLENGHILLELDGRDWIMDTGSPRTFGRGPVVLPWGSHAVPATIPTYPHLDAAYLSRTIGIEVDGILGTDLMQAWNWQIDLEHDVVVAAREPFPEWGSLMKIAHLADYSVMEFEVAGQRQKMIWDTGAQVGYTSNLPADARFEGRVRDFHPTIPTPFEVEVHQVTGALADQRLSTRLAPWPSELEDMRRALANCDISGILGVDLAEHRVLSWNPRRGELMLTG